jgi:hypothetical protein
MNEKPIVVSKSDLREIVAEFTSNDRDMQSRFWGSVMEAQKAHTRLLDEHTTTIAQIHTDIALMKQSQVRQEESQIKILTQTTKTNGRVNKLELWKAGVITSTSIIIGIAIYLSIRLLDLQNIVSAHIGTLTK